MADQEWLRNLAQARFHNGQWQYGDPRRVRGLAEGRLAQAAAGLEGLARDYCDVFNDMAETFRAMRVLPVASPPGQVTSGGFLLLLARCQLSVEFKVPAPNSPPQLEVTLYTVQGFQRQGRLIHRFRPEADAFGTLGWRLDNGLLLTDELIIKRLFEDLTRAAYEAGDL